jgi:hypothetical protein
MGQKPSFLDRVFSGLILLLLAGRAHADITQSKLDFAKTDYATAIEKATTALIAAFDKEITSVSQTGDIDAVEPLRTQRAAFLSSQTLPTAPRMKAAVQEYEETSMSAEATLKSAYDTAIADYTKGGQFDDAERVKKMKIERFSSLATSSPDNRPTTAPG